MRKLIIEDCVQERWREERSDLFIKIRDLRGVKKNTQWEASMQNTVKEELLKS